MAKILEYDLINVSDPLQCSTISIRNVSQLDLVHISNYVVIRLDTFLSFLIDVIILIKHLDFCQFAHHMRSC